LFLILEEDFDAGKENKTRMTAHSYHLYPGHRVMEIKFIWCQTWDENLSANLELQEE
jgi:hypothetical protein